MFVLFLFFNSTFFWQRCYELLSFYDLYYGTGVSFFAWTLQFEFLSFLLFRTDHHFWLVLINIFNSTIFLSRTDEYMFEKKNTWTDVCMVLYWACFHTLSMFCDNILDFSHFELSSLATGHKTRSCTVEHSSLSDRPQNKKLSCTVEQDVLDPDRVST